MRLRVWISKLFDALFIPLVCILPIAFAVIMISSDGCREHRHRSRVCAKACIGTPQPARCQVMCVDNRLTKEEMDQALEK